MNKKGLTVVELIVSFSLTIVIFIFLIQIILSLNNVYTNNGRKTEILNEQSIISDNINTSFIEKGLNSIEKCEDEEDCYSFYYENGDRDTLKINGDGILRFNELGIRLNGASFGNIKLDVIYSPTLQEVNNSIFILTIPINSDIDYDFDIKIIYQFNSETSLIDEYFSS